MIGSFHCNMCRLQLIKGLKVRTSVDQAWQCNQTRTGEVSRGRDDCRANLRCFDGEGDALWWVLFKLWFVYSRRADTGYYPGLRAGVHAIQHTLQFLRRQCDVTADTATESASHCDLWLQHDIQRPTCWLAGDLTADKLTTWWSKNGYN